MIEYKQIKNNNQYMSTLGISLMSRCPDCDNAIGSPHVIRVRLIHDVPIHNNVISDFRDSWSLLIEGGISEPYVYMSINRCGEPSYVYNELINVQINDEHKISMEDLYTQVNPEDCIQRYNSNDLSVYLGTTIFDKEHIQCPYCDSTSEAIQGCIYIQSQRETPKPYIKNVETSRNHHAITIGTTVIYIDALPYTDGSITFVSQISTTPGVDFANPPFLDKGLGFSTHNIPGRNSFLSATHD